MECGGAGIIIGDTSSRPGIFIRGTAAVEISSLLSVLRSNGIRCTSIRRKGGEFILFCDSYSYVRGIFEEEVTKTIRIINCDLVMPKDLKANRSLTGKSCGAMVYNIKINTFKNAS